MLKKIIPLIILIFFLSESISAQYRQRERYNIPYMSIGPEIGYFKSSDAVEGNLQYGFALRARLTPVIGLEGDVHYRQDDYSNRNLTIRSWPVTISANIFPLPVFYGTMGIGWYNSTLDFDRGLQERDLNDKSRSEFGWHLGGGLEIPASERINFKGEFRYVFLDYELEQIDEIPLEKIDSNAWSITFGILFGL